ncbi:MAG: type IV pilus twitching motility protein PilT [Phycisphaerae bacterium]
MNVNGATLELLRTARGLGASDLLLVAGAPPSIYINATMQPLRTEPMSAEQVRGLIDGLMDVDHRGRLDRDRDVDFAVGDASFGRCRVNVHYERGGVAAAIRFVSELVPDLVSLNLPVALGDCTRLPRGLVLVTGGTGSGKSTTLAAMINEINRETSVHIITLEDPVEYLIRNDRSIIEQREIGADSPSFHAALRHVVRQKPDVIMIGELRDLETIRAAVTAAEMGHLVLGSLHTINAAHTIERIVDVFDPAQQPQIRVQLAGALRVVACQTLFPTTDGTGLVPAVEILINTPGIARAIRDGETHLIGGMIETGADRGMQTLDRAIIDLVLDGRITRGHALAKAIDAARMEATLNRLTAEGRRTATAWG